MPAVVTDTGCLIALERVHQLSLLPALFGEVFAPDAVLREFGRTLPFVRKVTVLVDETLHFPEQFHAGEREAITFALRQGCLLLIDERRGRNMARRLGLEIHGTAGILLRAKERGLIAAVAPFLAELEAADVFLGERLINDTLRDAGEL